MIGRLIRISTVCALLCCAALGTVRAGSDGRCTIQVRSDRVVTEQFGGVGYHVFCHLHDMSRRQLNRVFARHWRELQPGFARVTHKWGWDLENVLPMLKVLKETDTTVYLTTWGPPTSEPGKERAEYGRRVARMLERLIRGHGLTNIDYFCLTNEMSLNGWGSLRHDLPKFRDYHRHIYEALQERNLDVRLLATDASPISSWNTIEWATKNMDDISGAYGGHHYINHHGLDDREFYDWFRGKINWGVELATEKGKPFIVGEFGARQQSGARYGYRRWDGCHYWNRPEEPMASIQIAEAVLAMVNGGVYGMGYWTFADFPDDYRSTYANKWGIFRWNNGDHATRPHYYALGLLSKFFSPPATVCGVKSSDELVRSAAVQRPDRGWSVAVVNRHDRTVPVRVGISGVPGSMELLRYVYNPEDVPHTAFGELQPPGGTLRAEDGEWTDTVPPRSLVVYTTAYDTKAPAPVKNVQVGETEEGSPRITWKASSADDICYYRVYRTISGPEGPDERIHIGNTVAAHFVDRHARPGEYGYDVVAVDRAGNPKRP